MSDVVAERHGAVLVCRLNRPAALNGLTGGLLGEYLGVLRTPAPMTPSGWLSRRAKAMRSAPGADICDLEAGRPGKA